MNTSPKADPETGPPDDVQELRQQIRDTREQLGETVEQLAAKTDLKARARSKRTELAGIASQHRVVLAAAAGALAAALLIIRWSRKR